MTGARAFIVGVAGPRLSAQEETFLREARPWGLIVFERNVGGLDQLRELVAGFRAAVGRADAPVLIDQEGGRVQRLKPPLAPRYPCARDLGALAAVDAAAGERATWLSARLIAHDLAGVGITVDCLPVLDLPTPGAHAVIGERAYGRSPDLVATLGRAAIAGLAAGGVLPVIKHIPGHGRARADSHVDLPVIDTRRAELEVTDFVPFRALADAPLAMTAHVLYTAIDAARPATLSPVVIGEIIRAAIGFDGCLMSDDVSMGALAGPVGEMARQALAAGCDLALHCNGDIAEMAAIAAAVPELSGDALRRADAALAARAAPEPLDVAAARAELDGLMRTVGAFAG